MNQEDVARGSQKTKKKAGKEKTFTGGVTFRPTKIQREVISQDWTDLSRNILVLENFLESGNKLSLGYANGTNAFFVSLREKAEDWQKARAVTVWHAETARCFSMLAYYLTEVNENFPEGLRTNFDAEEMSW